MKISAIKPVVREVRYRDIRHRDTTGQRHAPGVRHTAAEWAALAPPGGLLPLNAEASAMSAAPRNAQAPELPIPRRGRA
jgi:hypothetical protein